MKRKTCFLILLAGLTSFIMILNILIFGGHIYRVHQFGRDHASKGLEQHLTSRAPNSTHKTDIISSNEKPAKPAKSVAKSAGETSPNSSNNVSSAVVSATSKPKVNLPRPDECANCFVHSFTYLIQNPMICAPAGGGSIELLMLILTEHSHARQRQNIRKTWASVAKNNTGIVRYGFLLGRTLNNDQMEAVYAENKVYGDILMEDFMDAYSNLTLKTIMGMKWMTLFCPQAKYLMKTDDDMWVNVPQLLTLLGQRGKELQHGVGGACSLLAHPIRRKNSKWYASKISYPNPQYPGFCSGTGYVTSVEVVKKLYETSPNVPFFHLEDVYISLCIKRLGMKLKPLPGFLEKLKALDPCFMRSSKLVTSHMVPTDFLLKIMAANCKNFI